MPTVVIAVGSLLIGEFFLGSGSTIMLALLLGFVFANFLPKEGSIPKTTDYLGKRTLELAILFLAFGINYTSILALGLDTFSIIFILMALMVLITIVLAKIVKFRKEEAWLIGFGSSVCGSTAIAALAPVANAEKKDVASSMAIINILGAIGMLVMPYVLMEIISDKEISGLLLGGSLHSVGNVAGGAYIVSDEVGEVALTVKMARIAILSPALLFFGLLIRDKSGNGKKLKLPWYLLGFIIISTLVSVVPMPDFVFDSAHFLGKLMLTLAMAAIGLQVNFLEMIKTGWRGLLYGLAIFTIQLALLILMIAFI